METSSPAEPAACLNCGKPASLCVCAALAQVDNRIEVLVLRHPQEQDKQLGTASLLCRQLSRATLRTGLSWPNLARAVGHEADAKRWAVLYLGTARQAPSAELGPLVAVNGDGVPLADQRTGLADIGGLILLDGNWSQAKALWWRNPWLLKCHRLVLRPGAPSLYGDLRREPREESVSTLEAAALALAHLEGQPALAGLLTAPLGLLLKKFRVQAPRRPRGDRRRGRRRRKV